VNTCAFSHRTFKKKPWTIKKTFFDGIYRIIDRIKDIKNDNNKDDIRGTIDRIKDIKIDNSNVKYVQRFEKKLV